MSRLANLMSLNLQLFSYPSAKACVLDSQKNCLIEIVLLSNPNICFGCKIRINNFQIHTLEACSLLISFSEWEALVNLSCSEYFYCPASQE